MEEHIIKVLSELGKLIIEKEDELRYKGYEIDRLQRRIETLEQYKSFYNEEVSE